VMVSKQNISTDAHEFSSASARLGKVRVIDIPDRDFCVSY